MTDIGMVDWTDEDLRKHLDEFIELYETRPIVDNSGGMKAPHAFLAWFLFKALNPRFVIESGVFLGLGTWLIEKACPSARIYCIDPNLDRIKYRSENASYHADDFSYLDFDDIDKAHTLCFFDDHQNAYDRLRVMK